MQPRPLDLIPAKPKSEEEEEPLPEMEVLESPSSSDPAVRPNNCVKKVWKVRNDGKKSWPEGCVAIFVLVIGDVPLPKL